MGQKRTQIADIHVLLDFLLGPNECSDDTANPCCPGWQIAPTSGLCLIAVCDEGCGSGYCIGANLCRCEDGTLAKSCTASQSDYLPPGQGGWLMGALGCYIYLIILVTEFYKYDRHVTRGDRKTDDVAPESGCERLACQQRCHIIDDVAQCYCDSGYTLDQDGTTCNDVDECDQYSHVCSHGCRNTVGGFLCVCRSGYYLHKDGRMCVQVPAETTTRKVLAESRSVGTEKKGREYIDDMLDPRIPVPSERPPTISKPQLAIQARVRINRKQSSEKVPDVPAVGDGSHHSISKQYPRQPNTGSPRQPNIGHHRYPDSGQHRQRNVGQPRQPNIPYYNPVHGRLDPYNLPSQFNPNSRYGQLPPELTKQVFGKYDRKKLVPFDFDDSKHDRKFDPSVLSQTNQGSRAIFWEEIPTDSAGVAYRHPCEGTECPNFPDEYPTSLINPTEPFTNQQTTNAEPLSDVRRLRVRDRKQSKKSFKQTRRSKQRQRKRKGKQHKKFKTTTVHQQESSVSTTPQVPTLAKKYASSTVMPTTGMVNQVPSSTTQRPVTTNQVLNTTTSEKAGFNKEEMLQKDGRYCRGDLCYYPEELEDLDVTTPNIIKIDDFGQCPVGFEKVNINGYEVCKPLPAQTSKPAANLRPPNINSLESLGNVHAETDIDVINQIENIEEEQNKVAAVVPVKETLAPFINYCVKENKIMIITAKGILCRNKTEENIFVNCEQQEVYIETIAGYICRDPSIEDVLSTPIQCPLGHTIITTNTGYECRGTVVLESSCPDNYHTIQTMSGTICSPSAPLSPPASEVCGGEGSLMETENGIECKANTDELSAPDTVITNSTLPSVNITDSPMVDQSPNLTEKVKCPPGQIAVQTNNGSQCKYYSRLQQGRGDLPPSCPTGQTYMDTKSGPICIGTSIIVEYEGPITYDPSTFCPNGQQLVQTPTGEQCQDIKSLVLPTGDTLFIQGSCRLGQTKVGSECRWIGLVVTETEYYCPHGSSLQQTNFGLLCINDTTSKPAVDFNTVCSEKQIAFISPKGSLCRSGGEIGKILTVTDLEQFTSNAGCGQTLLEFHTLSGAYCLDRLTREPVIDDEAICAEDEIGVLTPKGMVCELRDNVFLYILLEPCDTGQSMSKTSAGTICVDQDTKKPIINAKVSCPDGQSAIVTPSGTYCFSLSDIQTVSLYEEDIELETCQHGQSVLQTAAGAICIDRETLLPVIDDALSCPDGQASVVTPTGSFCKLRSAILTRTSRKPGPKARIVKEHVCTEGHKVLNTAAGAICINIQTLLPIIDEAVACPQGQTAVVTPTGTLCKLRSAILTTVSKEPSPLDSVKKEVVVERCRKGQSVLVTAAGSICIHSETLLPMIDETVSCSDGHAPIVTPRGTFCRLRSALLTPVATDSEAVLSCEENQTILETAAGPICVHNLTQLPIFNKMISCPSREVSVVTPRGTFCKLQSGISVEINGSSSDLYCDPLQKVLETSEGPICIHLNNSLPVTNETQLCKGEEIPVITPTGTDCKSSSVIFAALSVDIDPTVHANTTPPCDVFRVYETAAGLICFHTYILLPKLDGTLKCEEGQVPAVTPYGSECKFRYDTLTLLKQGPVSINITADNISVSFTCGEGRSVQQLSIGVVCTDSETLSPVINRSVVCPPDQVGVVTPSGIECMLETELFPKYSPAISRFPGPGRSVCKRGQEVFWTKLGDICLYEESLLPVIDPKTSCPDGEIPLVTPSGTFCAMRSFMLAVFSIQSNNQTCVDDQLTLRTKGGLICVLRENNQPVIHGDIPCESGMVSVQTPTGPMCMLRAILFGKFFKSFGVYTENLSTNISLHICPEGQIFKDTEIGDLCLDNITMQPIIDEIVECPKGQLPVFTPGGVQCKPQSVILTMISKNDRDKNTVEGMSQLVCGKGYVIHGTTSGLICINENTKQPVIDDSMNCVDGQLAVRSPTGTFCMLKSVVFAKLTKTQTKTTPTPSSTTESLKCGSGQVVLKTDVGVICIFEESKTPVIDAEMVCPDEQSAVVSPSGTFCMLTTAIFAKLSSIKETIVTIAAPATCLTLDTDVGPICVDKETQQPMLDKSVSCEDNKIPVLTPFGTSCKLISAIMVRTAKKPATKVDTVSPANKDIQPQVQGNCGENQTIYQSDYETICIYTETNQPVLNETIACEDGHVSVVTPSGDICILRAVLISKIMNVDMKIDSMTTSVTGVTTDDPVKLTTVPQLATDDPATSTTLPSMLTNDPVLSTSVHDLSTDSSASSETEATTFLTTASVVSSGLFSSSENPDISTTVSDLSTTVPLVLTSISDDLPLVSTTTESVTCNTGQNVLDTEFGPICVDIKTSEPVIDPSILCKENSQAVVTPNGPICFMNNAKIFGKLIKIENDTALPDPCGAGLKVYKLKSSRICVDEETGQPVINEEFYCPGMKIGVLSPNGVTCKSKKVILSGEFFGTIHAPVTPKLSGTTSEPKIEITESNVILAGCKAGQRIYQTKAGAVCVYSNTLNPVIDSSVFCPDGQAAVLTPSGTSCRLRERILIQQPELATPIAPKLVSNAASTCPPGQKSILGPNGFSCETIPLESESTTSVMTTLGSACRDGQLVGEAASGLICIYEDTLEPVLDEEFNCPLTKVAVVTPSGTVCLFRKDILDTVDNSIPTSRIPICIRGQVPVLRDGKFVCRHLIINKVGSKDGKVPVPTSISKQKSRCPPGQLVHVTNAGDICVDNEQLQPIVDESISCPTGQISVMTPLGFACKFQMIIFRNIPKVTGSDLDIIKGCPPGQVVVVENQKLVCKGEDEVEDTVCPPGYRKVYFEGVAGQPCEYVGFGKEMEDTKKSSREEDNREQSYKCLHGQILKQTPDGPRCTYVNPSPSTKMPLPTTPERNYRPEIVNRKRKPCTPGIDCPEFENEKPVMKSPCIPGVNCDGRESETYGPRLPCGGNCIGPQPCQGSTNCGRFEQNIGMPGPCQQGVNCFGTIPRVGLPMTTNCLNGIQVSNGQPCASSGNIPWPGYAPCNSGGCGNAIPPVAPCQTGMCGNGANGVPPQYGGCGQGITNGNGCGGGYPNLPYKYNIRQSCSSGFQPHQRGKVYMCIPLNFRGMCGDNMMLKSLLGQGRCSGIHQAVPPRQTLTPCSPSGRNPLTGKLNSGCTPVEGLQALEDSSQICQQGEKLFRTSKGSTVCLQAASVGSSSVSNIQQEAAPSCRADEELVKTDRGYVCQRKSQSDCDPVCANGGQCMGGVCRCPRVLTGNACQTDIDECKRLPARYCHYKCENSFGSFRCFCPEGYVLNSDKKTCTGVNCSPGCRNGGTCTGGVCRCPSGFTGKYCQTDIDECSRSRGLCEHKCVNTPGSYSCVCPPGAKLREDNRTCENIAESCLVRCQNGATCRKHRCFCAPGYFGVSCQLDINECYHFRPCSHVCHNTQGSYICGCQNGYQLATDGHKCIRSSPPDGSTRSRQRRRLISRRTRHKLS